MAFDFAHHTYIDYKIHHIMIVDSVNHVSCWLVQMVTYAYVVLLTYSPLYIFMVTWGWKNKLCEEADFVERVRFPYKVIIQNVFVVVFNFFFFFLHVGK